MKATNNYSSDFLDILFDGRNKDYGAYDLRRSQDRRVRNAIICTASLALVIMGGYVVSSRLQAAELRIPRTLVGDVITIRDIKQPKEKPVVTPPPPAHVSAPPPAAASIKSVTPTIIADDKVRPEDEMPKLDSIGNKTIALATNAGDVDGADIGSLLGRPGGTGLVVEGPTGGNGRSRDTVFDFVEVMPSFPGGEAALARFLRDNVHYPNMAAENEVQGRIYVQFVVDWDGNITGVKTIGAQVGAGLEEEAMRVVKKMPKWKPGRQNGQSVSVSYNLPVSFHLQ
jgi:periplasmic protein TonB